MKGLKLLDSLLPNWVGEGFQAVLSASPRNVLVAVILYLVSILMYMIRIVIIFLRLGYRIKPQHAAKAHLATILVNNLTPFSRAGGEAARIAYIYSHYPNTPLAVVISAIAAERLTDGISITLLALLAVALGLFTTREAWAILVLALLTITGFILVRHYWDKLIQKAAEKLPEKYKAKILSNNQSSNIMQSILQDKLLIITCTSIGLVVWVLDAARLYSIITGLGYEIDFSRAIAATILYLALGLLAFTPGGLGIIEGGLTAILTTLGLPASKAVAATLIERLISYGLGTMLGALVILIEGGRQAWRRLRLQ